MRPYEIRIRVTAEGVEVFDSAGRSLKRMEHAASGVDDKLQRVSRTLESIGKKSMLVGVGIVAGVGAVAYAGIKYNASVEMMKRKLEIFLKTNERVSEAFKWAQEAVLGTPLMTAQMVENIVTLEQSGLAYQRWGKIVSDTAAALLGPSEDLNTTMLEFSQAIGRIAVGDTGMGIARLRELGIQIHETGIRFNKQGQAIDSTAVILEKLRRYMLKFEGSTEDLGKTFKGRIAAMKGQLIRLLGAGMEPAFDELNTQLERLIKWVRSEEGQKKLKEWAKSFGDMMVSATKLAKVLAENLLPAAKKLIDWFTKLGEKKQLALITLPLIGGAALVTAGKVLELVSAFKKFKAASAGCAVTRAGCAAGFEGIGKAAGGAKGKIAGAAIALRGFGTAATTASVAAGGLVGIMGYSGFVEIGKVQERKRKLGPYAGPTGYGVYGTETEMKAATKQRAAKAATGISMGPYPPTTSQKIATGMKAGKGVEWAESVAAERGLTLSEGFYKQYGRPGGGEETGGGGGGGGGIGTRVRGGNVIYQTIEKVEIKANKIDEKSLLEATRKIVETELPS